MNRHHSAAALALLLLAFGAGVASCGALPEDDSTSSGVTRSEVRRTDDGWQLHLDGEPFHVRGAALEFGSIESLAAHGANSFRTWRTENGRRSGREVLDEAHRHGLKVTMGLDVGRERQGFDYGDADAVAAQLARIRGEVERLKDHPALILWAIGNELNHHATDPRVWDAVNEISLMIHEVDPHHLTTTPLSSLDPELVSTVQLRAPDLDLLSVQMYAEIEVLPERIAASGWDGPLLVTEWGATGYWEVGTTDWGAPLENDSSTKADLYGERYRGSIASQRSQVVGSYVFLWGQKQERTPTWFGMFTPDGRETEAVHVMHEIWTGAWPADRAPRVQRLLLDGRSARDGVRLMAGESYEATFEAEDPEGGPLRFRWQVMRESASTATGGDPEREPSTVAASFVPGAPGHVTFTAPGAPGAYRLFAYADDEGVSTAHANIPFLVE
ncbi:MAG: glycoside hydrolase family 2 TIM barrel-domain containing protein [Planctomycetota bacterium]